MQCHKVGVTFFSHVQKELNSSVAVREFIIALHYKTFEARSCTLKRKSNTKISEGC